MSEQWSKFDSEQPNLDPQATDDSSANGVSSDYTIGLAEPPGEEAAATDAELTDDEAPVEAPTDDAAVSEAAGEAPVGDVG